MSLSETQLDSTRWIKLEEGVWGLKPPFSQSPLNLTEEFKDLVELMRAADPLKRVLVEVVQGTRRHPRLREKVEQIAERLGRKVDLNQRLT